MQTDAHSIIPALASGRFEFLDLGCGNGGSIRHCQERFKRAPGVGFELDEERVREAQSFGLNVVRADVRELVLPERSVGYVSMMDFLEHLPDERSAAEVMQKAARTARDFLFIRSNPRGHHFERWRHVNGCARFFNEVRETVSDRFLTTYKAGEPRPDISSLTGGTE